MSNLADAFLADLDELDDDNAAAEKAADSDEDMEEDKVRPCSTEASPWLNGQLPCRAFSSPRALDSQVIPSHSTPADAARAGVRRR